MEKFEVIIVGAGLAGLAAAYTLADSGVEVLVLERGDYPGAKNVTGGRLYVHPIRHLFPDLWDAAPLERPIVHEGFTLMAQARSVAMDYSGEELRQAPHQSYSILRARFDRWLAEQAEARGAMILTKVAVEEVIQENGKIAGVMAGGDELRADVVIACDGVLSRVAEQAGLHKPGVPGNFALGLKEVISLDPTLIDERFHLENNEGAARLYVGALTAGSFGGGFLYTNRDSISLGLVVGLESLAEKNVPPDVPALLDAFKARPEIAPLIKGGQTAEYAAHLIPEGGLGGLFPLYGEGLLVAGDAAGLALNMGVTVRGMEYALASGYYAAQTVLQVREKGNFTAADLAVYERLLNDSFVLRDFRNFREAPHVLANPRFFTHYPELAGNILRDIYETSGEGKNRLSSTVRKYLPWTELWALFKDGREVSRI